MSKDPVWIDEQGRPTARCMDCNAEFHLVVGQLMHLQVDEEQQVWVMCDACAERLEKAKSGRTN